MTYILLMTYTLAHCLSLIILRRRLTSDSALPSHSRSNDAIRLLRPKALKNATSAACSFLDIVGAPVQRIDDSAEQVG